MNLTLHRFGTFCVTLSALVMFAFEAQSSPFVYTNSDLMLCFRKIQRNGGVASPNDYEVNIGHASVYYSAAPGSSFTITQFNTNQIKSVYPSLNNVSWSVAGGTVDGDGTAPGMTLWITKKRTSLNVQSVPPTRRSLGFAQNAVNNVNGVGEGAVFYSNGQPPHPTNNTVTSVTIPESSTYNYSTFIDANGIYTGYWGGDAEDTTISTFTAGTNPSRIDLYELRVGSGNGTFLGYFDFMPTGAVKFTAAGGLTQPTITSFTRNDTSSVIAFTTAASTVYNLRYTNGPGLSAPVGSWPVISNIVSGDGTTKAVTNVTSDPQRFYRIEAHF